MNEAFMELEVNNDNIFILGWSNSLSCSPGWQVIQIDTVVHLTHNNSIKIPNHSLRNSLPKIANLLKNTLRLTKMSLFRHQNSFGEILHYITCSSMDPLQWMGANRMRAQTADKTSQ